MPKIVLVQKLKNGRFSRPPHLLKKFFQGLKLHDD